MSSKYFYRLLSIAQMSWQINIYIYSFPWWSHQVCIYIFIYVNRKIYIKICNKKNNVAFLHFERLQIMPKKLSSKRKNRQMAEATLGPRPKTKNGVTGFIKMSAPKLLILTKKAEKRAKHLGYRICEALSLPRGKSVPPEEDGDDNDVARLLATKFVLPEKPERNVKRLIVVANFTFAKRFGGREKRIVLAVIG